MADGLESPTRILDTRGEDSLVGRQVRDLRVLERIGRGGMGTVYKAEHVLLREPRALKVMRAELFQAMPMAVERFEREARIAVKLRHPNLVLLHDFFVEDGDRFLVMEYVLGESLATVMSRRGALALDEVCSIGMQCCAGLSHAHEMGIVHRDLSPENVMISATPSGTQVKIIDFGVARAAFETSDQTRAEEEATLTRIGQFIGKPRYSSPEQAGSLARGERIDPRSDLYTLGLILFEMVTAKFPFSSQSDVGFLAKHSFEKPATPSALRPDLEIPPGLERVILRCLEKDRVNRFADARELQAALEWVRRTGGRGRGPFDRDAVSAVADPHATRPIRVADHERPTRRPALGPAIAALTVLGVVAGGGTWWFFERGERRPVVVAAPTVAPVAPAVVAPEVVAPEPAPAEPAPPEPAAAEVAVEAPPQREPEPVEAPRIEAPAATEAAARAEPVPRPEAAPAPARAAAPPVVAFANADEMARAFDEALEFERTHAATAAIANWKAFRARSPSSDLDERAKRRITDLILGGLREVR